MSFCRLRHVFLTFSLTEGDNIGKAINEAMKAIEDENSDLKKQTQITQIDNPFWLNFLRLLEKLISPVTLSARCYFLGEFALAEGQKGGVF